jgi:hypothetical protein
MPYEMHGDAVNTSRIIQLNCTTSVRDVQLATSVAMLISAVWPANIYIDAITSAMYVKSGCCRTQCLHATPPIMFHQAFVVCGRELGSRQDIRCYLCMHTCLQCLSWTLNQHQWTHQWCGVHAHGSIMQHAEPPVSTAAETKSRLVETCNKIITRSSSAYEISP